MRYTQNRNLMPHDTKCAHYLIPISNELIRHLFNESKRLDRQFLSSYTISRKNERFIQNLTVYLKNSVENKWKNYENQIFEQLVYLKSIELDNHIFPFFISHVNVIHAYRIMANISRSNEWKQWSTYGMWMCDDDFVILEFKRKKN